MGRTLRKRRMVAAISVMIIFGVALYQHSALWQPEVLPQPSVATRSGEGEAQELTGDAVQTLEILEVKGRAAKTGYTRSQFGNGWQRSGGCDTRNIILARDMTDITQNAKCQVVSGTLHDPYTGKTMTFVRGEQTSQAVQIDHVVALSNAWQTGAQQLSKEARARLANDPLELLAVQGAANQQKSAGDAATWLPSNKAFRCQYVARQIAVKQKYHLWVTQAEKDAMKRVLMACPGQALPQP